MFGLLIRTGDIISGILAMSIMGQFIGQGVGLMLLRKRNGKKDLPYKMPLYPVPVILTILMYLFVFYATDGDIIINFAIVLLSELTVCW